MLFFGKRQSKDNILRDKMLSLTEGKLFVNEFSANQFDDKEKLCISESFLDDAGDNDLCFVENITFDINKVNTLYIFNWNRLYPSDFYFDYDYKDNFKKVKTEKFEGSSHPKITLETYIRKV